MREKHYHSKNDCRYYRTSDLYLAAYLYAHTLAIVNIDKTNPKRCVFVFRDTPQRENLEKNFLFGIEAPVDAILYAQAIRDLKEKIHDSFAF